MVSLTLVVTRMSEDFNISASQVKQFDNCPKAYEYSYLTDIEPTKADKGYLALGSRVHESIEEVLQSEDCPPFGDRKMISKAITNTYHEKDEYPLDDEKYGTGVQCCDIAGKVLHKMDPDIRDVEATIRYDIDRDDLVTGVTAKMDITTDSKIWDWKTGTIRDDSIHGERIQGATYMAAYYNRYGEPPEEIMFIYLKEGGDDTAKVRRLEPTDDNWQYLLKYARKLNQAKEQDRWKATPGDFCYLCEWEGWCDASPVGVGGVPYEDY